MKPRGSTRVFALLGDPVAHSLSPGMHNAGFQVAGIDAVYVALRVAPDAVAPAMRMLVESGGGGNITVPHKVLAAATIGTADAEHSWLGAVNVFGGVGDTLRVGNTDVAGVVSAVGQLQPLPTRWRVIGTGGSARAAGAAARQLGCAVRVVSRDRERGAAFTAWLAAGDVAIATDDCDLVINATPLGLADGDPFPVAVADIPRQAAVLDLVYRSGAPTRWGDACATAGHTVIDGREVLLAQGVASWRYWFDESTDVPVAVMRAAIYGQLA